MQLFNSDSFLIALQIINLLSTLLTTDACGSLEGSLEVVALKMLKLYAKKKNPTVVQISSKLE